MKRIASSNIEATVQRAVARSLNLEDLRVSLLGDVAHVEGTVPSFEAKGMAVETVRLLTGASEVVNRLRVVPFQATGDRALREAVHRALSSQLNAGTTGLSVHATQGVVELKGNVASLSDRCAAESAAWSVGGVTDVRNRLEVQGQATSPESLARQLRQAVSQCLQLDVSSIEVLARGDTVYLRGRVPSPYHRLAAEDLVRAHSQVREVVNELLSGGAPVASRLPQSRRSA